jgi:hypothetical protein
MTHSRIALSAIVLVGIAVAAPRAAEARLDVGIGTILGRTGISTGLNYRFGGWGDRFGANVFLDASRYVNRSRKKSRDKDREPEQETRKREGPENVALRVSPDHIGVFLNGVLVDMQGRAGLDLPPGRHRLEFVRPGYRTEVAELEVQPDLAYTVERKLSKLQKGEREDERLAKEKRLKPVSVYEALRSTEAQWDLKRRAEAQPPTEPATR